ncbi:carboxymuconolactone decarboxylase family protein [Tumebacillus lipolyticus]|uniref:Carboxymuconolactone decarboxylase family protein n=1 Tax=Tumebacillus lipolyticus TaxID=1280370 RepID=A0ABW4ZZN6_9BACL
MAILAEQTANFSPREQVALAYVDQMMAYHGVIPDELMSQVKAHFSEDELVALTFHIGLMNAANWFVIAMELEQE